MTKAAFIATSDLDQLLNSDKPVVIDYTATWCGPCRIIAPHIDQLAEEYKDSATVVKIDIDNNKETARKYQIKSIPAVLIFKHGIIFLKMVN